MRKLGDYRMKEHCPRQPTYEERVSQLSSDGATLVDRMFVDYQSIAVSKSIYYQIVDDQVWELHHTTGAGAALEVIAREPISHQSTSYTFDWNPDLHIYALSAISPPDYPSEEKLNARPESAPPARFDQLLDGSVQEYLEDLKRICHKEALPLRIGEVEPGNIYSALMFTRVTTDAGQFHSFDQRSMLCTEESAIPLTQKRWDFTSTEIGLTLTSGSIEMDGLLGMNDEQKLLFQKEGVDYLRMLREYLDSK